MTSNVSPFASMRNRIDLGRGKYYFEYSDKYLIGKGNFARVYRGFAREGDVLVAVKVVSEAYLHSNHGSVFTKAMQLMNAEIEILKKSDHPNIVRHLADDAVRYGADTLHCFVLEYCSLDLDKYVKQASKYTSLVNFVGGQGLLPLQKDKEYRFVSQTDYNGSMYYKMTDLNGRTGLVLPTHIRGTGLQGKTAITLLKDMCSALHFMQTNGILHRDIKPENILVQQHIDGTIVFKLTDFGLAIEGKIAATGVGTEDFKAPEMHTNAKATYSHGVDVWAMGVTLFWAISDLFICGTPMFTLNVVDLITKVIQFDTNEFVKTFPNYTRHQSRGVCDTYLYSLFLMLQKNPDKRCNTNQLKTITNRLSTPTTLQSFISGKLTTVYVFPKIGEIITDTYKRRDLVSEFRRGLDIGKENLLLWSESAGLINENNDDFVQFSQLTATNLLFIRGSELANPHSVSITDKSNDTGVLRSFFEVQKDGFATLKSLLEKQSAEAEHVCNAIMSLYSDAEADIFNGEEQLAIAANIIGTQIDFNAIDSLGGGVGGGGGADLAAEWELVQAGFATLKQTINELIIQKEYCDNQLLNIISSWKSFSEYRLPDANNITKYLRQLQIDHFELRTQLSQGIIKENKDAIAREMTIQKAIQTGQFNAKVYVENVIRCLSENQSIIYPIITNMAALKNKFMTFSNEAKAWRAQCSWFWSTLLQTTVATGISSNKAVNKTEFEKLEGQLQLAETINAKNQTEISRLKGINEELNKQINKSLLLSEENSQLRNEINTLHNQIDHHVAELSTRTETQSMIVDSRIARLENLLNEEKQHLIQRQTQFEADLQKELKEKFTLQRENAKLIEETKSLRQDIDRLKSGPRPSVISMSNPSMINSFTFADPQASRKKVIELEKTIKNLEAELESIKKMAVFDAKFAESSEVARLKKETSRISKHWYRQHRALAEIAMLVDKNPQSTLWCGCALNHKPQQECAEMDAMAVVQAVKARALAN